MTLASITFCVNEDPVSSWVLNFKVKQCLSGTPVWTPHTGVHALNLVFRGYGLITSITAGSFLVRPCMEVPTVSIPTMETADPQNVAPSEINLAGCTNPACQCRCAPGCRPLFAKDTRILNLSGVTDLLSNSREAGCYTGKSSCATHGCCTLRSRSRSMVSARCSRAAATIARVGGLGVARSKSALLLGMWALSHEPFRPAGAPLPSASMRGYNPGLAVLLCPERRGEDDGLGLPC